MRRSPTRTFCLFVTASLLLVATAAAKQPLRSSSLVATVKNKNKSENKNSSKDPHCFLKAPAATFVAVPLRGGGARKQKQQQQQQQRQAAKGGAGIAQKTKNPSFLFSKLRNHLFTKKKLPWIFCSVLSLYYLVQFERFGLVESASSNNPYYKEGFCVTGLSTIDGTCSATAGNSHQFAFGIDVIFTILAVLLPSTGLCQSPSSTKLHIFGFVFGAIIIGHGMLHYLFSAQSCNGGGSIDGYVFYVLALMLVDVFGFSSIPKWGREYYGAAGGDADDKNSSNTITPAARNGIVMGMVLSAILTAIIYQITVQDQSISVFFMLSQLMVSLTGWLAPNENTITEPLGWAFLLPIVVSLIEYTNCSNFLVQYGGHAPYDIFLHSAMLVALLTLNL